MFGCSSCDRQFKTEDRLRSHAGRVHGTALFDCRHCKASFTKAEKLKKHIIVHSDERPFACDQCSHRFRLLKELITHQKKNHKYDIRTASLGRCKLCGARYEDLNEHLNTFHPDVADQLFECDICQDKFRTRYHISCHMQSHINLRPFQCSQCPRSFNFKTHLNLHYRTHVAIRPYQCELCGKSFKFAEALKSHMRTHSGEKPYKCLLCPNSYGAKKSLGIHMRIHNGEKPYKCPVCERAFHDGSTMKSHWRLHDRDSKFACHLCDTRTKLAKHLKSHYHQVHKIKDITSPMIRETAKRAAAKQAAARAAEEAESSALMESTDINVNFTKTEPQPRDEVETSSMPFDEDSSDDAESTKADIYFDDFNKHIVDSKASIETTFPMKCEPENKCNLFERKDDDKLPSDKANNKCIEAAPSIPTTNPINSETKCIEKMEPSEMCSVVMNNVENQTQIEFVSVIEKNAAIAAFAAETDELNMEEAETDNDDDDDDDDDANEEESRTIEISDDSDGNDDDDDDVAERSKPTEEVFVAPYTEGEVYRRHSPVWNDFGGAGTSSPCPPIEIADSPPPQQNQSSSAESSAVDSADYDDEDESRTFKRKKIALKKYKSSVKKS